MNQGGCAYWKCSARVSVSRETSTSVRSPIKHLGTAKTSTRYRSSQLTWMCSYAGADLSALCKEAANVAVTRIFNELGQSGSATKAPSPAPEEARGIVDLTVSEY